MTKATALHLAAWIERAVRSDLQDSATDKVLRFLAENPHYADGSYPWTLVMDRADAWSAQ